MKRFHVSFMFLVIHVFCFSSLGNNIAVSSAVVIGQNTSAGVNNSSNFCLVRFNLSWENSWRWNSSAGSISYIGVKASGSGYTGVPQVYIGSEGAVQWTSNTSVTIGQLLFVSSTPTNRFYRVTATHTTLASAPTHTSGTVSNLEFVSINNGGGTGATATATVVGGIITGYSISSPGSGYTSLPTISIFPTNGGTGATADVHITSWWDAAWVFVKFRVGASNPTFTAITLTSGSNTFTVNNVSNLRVGMPVQKVPGVGSGSSTIPALTVITAINSTTNTVTISNPVGGTTASNNNIEFVRFWEHASIHSAGHTASPGSTIDASSPSGVFIYRDAAGAGNNSFNNVRLRWNYGLQGVRDDALVTIQVFGIEMVYVPGGVDFNVGGGGGTSAFTPTTINTAMANTAPSGTGSLGGAAGGYPSGQSSPASASWPNGYNAFYCMKYEISQGQMRDFLNSLSYSQQASFTTLPPNTIAGAGALSRYFDFRQGIQMEVTGSPVGLPAVYGCGGTGGESVACNYINWLLGCAYLDWSCLRPMTELEFEKACRGNQQAVSGEYAWGTNTSAGSDYTLSGVYTVSERISNNYSITSGNLLNAITEGSINGPIRVGIFADNSLNRGRITSGATYYGIMEMSGNGAELVVSMATATGLSYTGIHGDGLLSADGFANTTDWPGLTGGKVSASTGAGSRGGGWNSFNTGSTISDRSLATIIPGATVTTGPRGVRSVQQ
jgi:formylglycine-generating enzyme required for sulfatase activity